MPAVITAKVWSAAARAAPEYVKAPGGMPTRNLEQFFMDALLDEHPNDHLLRQGHGKACFLDRWYASSTKSATTCRVTTSLLRPVISRQGHRHLPGPWTRNAAWPSSTPSRCSSSRRRSRSLPQVSKKFKKHDEQVTSMTQPGYNGQDGHAADDQADLAPLSRPTSSSQAPSPSADSSTSPGASSSRPGAQRRGETVITRISETSKIVLIGGRPDR